MGPRLLKRASEHKYSFTDILGDEDVPQYDILSHTWGPDSEEVTYEDFVQQSNIDKAGYAKVRFCGEQAARDDLNYFWIDSCCINKGNGPELSEAINSMYRWYKNAARCYVYLPDVSATTCDTDAPQSNPDWQDEFKRSRWFTRGWTLQELLAPTSVEFFSVEGEKLGDKATLKQLISDITSVPVAALEGEPLTSFTVSEREGWAAGRQTKKPEDKAYSLLGLFNIYMSPIYGEGADHAFLRLQEEIEKRVRTLTGTAYDRQFDMLLPVPPNFTGRQEELARLEESLAIVAPGRQARAALVGIGGAGKTALASYYALTRRDCYSARFTVDATDTLSLRRDFTKIAKKLELPEALYATEVAVANLDASVGAVHDWMTDHPTGNWLLIFDNANDLDTLDLNSYLPSTDKGHVIITSQSSRQAASYIHGQPIVVGELLMADAEELFLQLSKLHSPTSEQITLCQQIVVQLGLLALAIEHAAAFVHSADISLPEFLESLEQNIHTCLDASPKDSLHQSTVQATVSMAYHKIQKRCNPAADLLCLLSVLDNNSVDQEFLFSPTAREYFPNWKMLSDRGEYHIVRKILFSFSMIQTMDVDGLKVFSMHPLVHATVQRLLTLEWQWKWLQISSRLCWRSASHRKLIGSAYFPHFQHIMRRSVDLFKREGRAYMDNDIWLVLGECTAHYRVYWQVLGLMKELNDICITCLEALDLTIDASRLAQIWIILTRCNTVQFIATSETQESVLHDFLVSQMTPEAASWMRLFSSGAIDELSATPFRPYTLTDVFEHTHLETELKTLVDLLKSAAFLSSTRGNSTATANVYIRLSQLPERDSWRTQAQRLLWTPPPLTEPIPGSSQHLDIPRWSILAAEDRKMGKIDSTITLLHHVINKAIAKPELMMVGPIPGYMAIQDLAHIYTRTRRPTEAAAVLAHLEPLSCGASEVVIARKYKDLYTWVRKLQRPHLEDHTQHASTLSMLKETHRVTREVFGNVSLSAFHAAFLLETFHTQPCCYSAEERSQYRHEVETGFAELYGGKAKLKLAEGMQMGKLLMEQGALEEGALVFELFAKEASATLGADDPITRQASRWLALATREIALEEQDKVNGKVSFERGSLCFRRSLG